MQPAFTSIKQAIPVGISECLMGESVRYNGGHKRSPVCMQRLAKYFELRPVCPEVAIGLGVPREPIRLVEIEGEQRATSMDGQTDHSPALAAQAETFLTDNPDLCGIVLTQKSPSCGLFRVKVYNPEGNALPSTGRGAFAAAVLERNPLLPAEEAGRLNDAMLRENFITRVFAAHHWRELCANQLTRCAIIDFYSRYKYLMLAHHTPTYKAIGRLLASAGSYRTEELARRFITCFMEGLAHPATRRQLSNALEHMRGHLKRQLDSREKAEMGQLIEGYRRGQLPLIAPLVLLRHHIGRSRDSYVRRQTLLAPFPDDLHGH